METIKKILYQRFFSQQCNDIFSILPWYDLFYSTVSGFLLTNSYIDRVGMFLLVRPLFWLQKCMRIHPANFLLHLTANHSLIDYLFVWICECFIVTLLYWLFGKICRAPKHIYSIMETVDGSVWLEFPRGTMRVTNYHGDDYVEHKPC